MVGVYASAGGREGAPGLHPRGTQSPSGILLRVVCLFISLLAGREIMVDDGGIYFSIICICIGRTLRIFDKS